MHHRRALGATVAAAGLLLAACGSEAAGDGASSDARTIDITMADNAYDPADVTVGVGEEVTFRFTNEGELEHEALIGTEADQEAHEQEMADGATAEDGGHEGMDHGGGELVTVPPGESRSMTMVFDEAGTVLIGCHVPGHYAAGMQATITVEP